MRDLVRSQLGHYGDRIDSQIEMTGESLQIRPDAAQHIGMALHELATNAAKYGALSTPTGKVGISWKVEPAADGIPMCAPSHGKNPAVLPSSVLGAAASAAWSSNAPSRARCMAKFVSITPRRGCAGHLSSRKASFPTVKAAFGNLRPIRRVDRRLATKGTPSPGRRHGLTLAGTAGLSVISEMAIYHE